MKESKISEKDEYKYNPCSVKIFDEILYFHIKSKYSINEYLSINLLYLLMLNEIKDSMIKDEGNEIVISFPSYYEINNILYLKEIYKLLNLKVLNAIPEYLSISLCYGFENNLKIPKSENHLLLIVDIGYININVTLNNYKKDECIILSHMNSKNVNGRIIDQLIFKSICKKLHINEKECKTKLYIKILDEIIKMKEKLSADGADSV